MNKIVLAAVAASIATSANAATVVNTISDEQKALLVAKCEGTIVNEEIITKTINTIANGIFNTAEKLTGGLVSVEDNKCVGLFNNMFYVAHDGAIFDYTIAEATAADFSEVVAADVINARIDAVVADLREDQADAAVALATVAAEGGDVVAAAEVVREVVTQIEYVETVRVEYVDRIVTETVTVEIDNTDYAAVANAEAARDAAIAGEAAANARLDNIAAIDANAVRTGLTQEYAATSSGSFQRAVYRHRTTGELTFEPANPRDYTAATTTSGEFVVDGYTVTIELGRAQFGFDTTGARGLGINHVGAERLMVALADTTFLAEIRALTDVVEAYERGYTDGYADGYADGFKDGFAEGVRHAQSM